MRPAPAKKPWSHGEHEEAKQRQTDQHQIGAVLEGRKAKLVDGQIHGHGRRCHRQARTWPGQQQDLDHEVDSAKRVPEPHRP